MQPASTSPGKGTLPAWGARFFRGGCERARLLMSSLFWGAVAGGTNFLYLLIPEERNLSFQTVTIKII